MLRAIMIGSVTGYFSRAVAQKQALLLLPFGLQRACCPNLNSCGALGRGYKRALRVAQAAYSPDVPPLLYDGIRAVQHSIALFLSPSFSPSFLNTEQLIQPQVNKHE